VGWEKNPADPTEDPCAWGQWGYFIAHKTQGRDKNGEIVITAPFRNLDLVQIGATAWVACNNGLVATYVVSESVALESTPSGTLPTDPAWVEVVRQSRVSGTVTLFGCEGDPIYTMPDGTIVPAGTPGSHLSNRQLKRVVWLRLTAIGPAA
jgi:hypothetical protein